MDVISLKKVCGAILAGILCVLAIVTMITLQGCRLACGANVEAKPTVTETRVVETYPPAPPPPIATAYYAPAPQLAK